MSTDRDVTRIVRSWLDEGVTALPDRVLDTVLDQVPATPQRRPWWPVRRLRDMNSYAKVAVAAAAVVLIALVGIRLLPGQGNTGASPPPPSPSPSASPSPSSSPSPAPSQALFPNGPLPAGSYTIQPFVGPGGLCRGSGRLHGSGRGGRLDPDHAHRSGWLGRARILCRIRPWIDYTPPGGAGLIFIAAAGCTPSPACVGIGDPPRRTDHPDRHDRRRRS